jgi:hypothetical protein
MDNGQAKTSRILPVGSGCGRAASGLDDVCVHPCQVVIMPGAPLLTPRCEIGVSAAGPEPAPLGPGCSETGEGAIGAGRSIDRNRDADGVGHDLANPPPGGGKRSAKGSRIAVESKNCRTEKEEVDGFATSRRSRCTGTGGKRRMDGEVERMEESCGEAQNPEGVQRSDDTCRAAWTAEGYRDLRTSAVIEAGCGDGRRRTGQK